MTEAPVQNVVFDRTGKDVHEQLNYLFAAVADLQGHTTDGNVTLSDEDKQQDERLTKLEKDLGSSSEDSDSQPPAPVSTDIPPADNGGNPGVA